MKKILTLLTTVSLLTVSGAAFAADDEKGKTEYKAKDNGGYEVEAKSSLETTDGTEKKGMRKVDVDVSDDGHVSREAKTVHSSDPKGLMNGTKDTQKTDYQEHDDGTVEHTAVDEHKDYNGTDRKTEVETKLNVKADGSVDKIVETTKKTDPKGLFNSSTEKTKTINGKAVK